MKLSKNTKITLIFTLLIFVAAAVGQRVAHGYIHPADPVIALAAMYLPLPNALLTVGVASVAADLAKGLYLLAPATLIIKLLMVAAVKALLKTKPAQKHPEIMVAPALLIPVPGFFISELIHQWIIGSETPFASATVTLRLDAIQAVGGILLLIFLYDVIRGIAAGRAEVRRMKEAAKKEEPTDEDA